MCICRLRQHALHDACLLTCLSGSQLPDATTWAELHAEFQVCGAVFRMDAKGRNPGVKYVHDRPEILFTLFRGYVLCCQLHM